MIEGGVHCTASNREKRPRLADGNTIQVNTAVLHYQRSPPVRGDGERHAFIPLLLYWQMGSVYFLSCRVCRRKSTKDAVASLIVI